MDSFEIRLTNLSWQATEQDLTDFLNTFARVKEVKLVLDFRQRSKGKRISSGLAYVKLEDKESLAEALKDVERTHMERKIKIIRAKPLSEKVPRTSEANADAKEDSKLRHGGPRGRLPIGDRPPRQEGDRPQRKEGDRP